MEENISNPSFSFIRLPRVFFENPLFTCISIEGRLTLSLLLDRYEVSKINAERFTDDSGRIFIYFTIDELCQKIGCGSTKAVGLLKELEKHKLIFKKRKNGNRATLIFLTEQLFEGLNIKLANSGNCTLQSTDSETCKFRKTVVSNNKESNNKMSNNQSSIIINEVTEDEIREQIEYDCIVTQDNKGLLDETVMIIADVLNGTSPKVRISGNDMPRSIVEARLRKLTAEHVTEVLSRLRHNTVKIANTRAYLLTMLYNAPSMSELSLAAEFARYTNGCDS